MALALLSSLLVSLPLTPRVAAVGWGTATLVETDDAEDAWYPQVAVDPSGNAMAVWRQWNGTCGNVRANRYVVGTGWGTSAQIGTDDVDNTTYPNVAVDAGGNAVAVWRQWSNTHRDVWARRYVVGTGWGTSELIEADDVENTSYPDVGVDAGGNAVAVWSQSNGTNWNLWANRYAVGAGWGTAGLIETNDTGAAVYPQVAVDAGGNAVAVWRQYDGAREGIWANRYAAGAGWGTARLIETDNSGDARTPQVAVDAGGNATAVWSQRDGASRWNTWANRYAVGTGWGTAGLIETNGTGDTRNPQVAAGAGGSAMAAWAQWDGLRYNIWANRYVVGGGWGAAELIETGSVGDAWDPQVAVNANGDAVAVWSQWDGTRFSIWSNRYVAPDLTDPAADAGPDQSVVAGDMVDFDGSGSTDNVGIVNYTWTFDDLGTKTLYGVLPSYRFDNAGTFVVTLTVRDAAGNSDTDDVVITVTPLQLAVTVTPDAATVYEGAGQGFAATVVGNGDDLTSSSSITWSVDPASCGAFSPPTGAATTFTAAEDAGGKSCTVEANATYTSGPNIWTATGTAEVTITHAGPITVTITPTTANPLEGEVVHFTAAVTDVAGHDMTSLSAIAWTVTPSGCGLFDATTGSATNLTVAVDAGGSSCTVTASATFGTWSADGTAAVSVRAPASPGFPWWILAVVLLVALLFVALLLYRRKRRAAVTENTGR